VTTHDFQSKACHLYGYETVTHQHTSVCHPATWHVSESRLSIPLDTISGHSGDDFYRSDAVNHTVHKLTVG